jgi:UDP-glucose 4-epimerase
MRPRRPGDPATLVASKDKLKKLLNWEAQHSSLEEIVTSAWNWKVQHPQGYSDSVK